MENTAEANKQKESDGKDQETQNVAGASQGAANVPTDPPAASKQTEELVTALSSVLSSSFAKLTDQISQSFNAEYEDYEEGEYYEEEGTEADSEQATAPGSQEQGEAFDLLQSMLSKQIKPKQDPVQGPPNDPRIYGDKEYRVPGAGTSQATASTDEVTEMANKAIKAIQEQLDGDGNGKPVNVDIAEFVGQLLKAGIAEDKLKDKMNEYLRPDNTPNLMSVKVNQIIWDNLSAAIRSFDVKMQKTLLLLVKGMIATIRGLDEVKTHLNSQLMGAFQAGLDAIVFLVAAMRELNVRRRDLIKPGINKDYAHLCVANIPASEWLFGDDLAAKVKDLSELNKVAHQLQHHRGRGRGRGRGFVYRGRGRGHHFRGRGFHPYQGGNKRGRGRGAQRGNRGGQSGKDQVNNGKMAGKLSLFADNWRLLTNDPFILDTVLHSHLDFVDQKPVQKWEPQPINFNDSERKVIDEEIATLLDKGVIVECSDTEGQFVSNIFTREKKNGSVRVILNLSKLNLSVEYHKFKMETLNSIIKLMRLGCYMASLDLKDAYYSVPIAEEQRKFLRFRWGDKLFQFTCFPNGLTSAFRKFTKLMKPVLAHLRLKGYTNAIYIDDTFLTGDSPQECKNNVRETKTLLTQLGFTINEKKSVEEPSQQLVMLGFLLDSASMSVQLTPEKANKLRIMCLDIKDKRTVSVRYLAQVIGTLCSAFSGVEFVALHYRELERVKCAGLNLNRGNFDGAVTLSQEAVANLDWWIGNVDLAKRMISHGDPSVTLETDASTEGWGAYYGVSTGGRWTMEERKLHINCLELVAAFFGLKCFCEDLRDTHVRIMIDNTTAVSYINSMGGMKSQICDKVTKSIWLWCIERGIWISACHIPGKLNIKADKASREFNDRTEWMLHREVFLAVTLKFGVPDLDLFASRLNKQLPRFVSWQPDPDAEAVDAFMINWRNTYMYMFPPFSLIGACLQKMAGDGTDSSILIAPLWTTQPWFPQLMAMLIAQPLLLPERNILSLPGARTVHKPIKVQLMACLCSGLDWKAKEFRQTLPNSCSNRGVREHSNHTTASFRDGQTFVVKGRLMSFEVL